MRDRSPLPSRRARGPLLAGALLAGLVVLALGVGLGRATAPDRDPAGAAEPVGPGPTGVVHGVPVGYERTPDGAVAAAANYTAVLGGKRNIDPAFGHDAYPVFALPDVADDLLRRSEDFGRTVADPVYLANDPGLVFRPAPLGYRLEHYSPDEATVTVWALVTGVGTPELPVATAWATEQLTLRWVDADWKVAAIDRDSGPTPPSPGDVPETDLAERMRSFRPFTYLPEARP